MGRRSVAGGLPCVALSDAKRSETLDYRSHGLDGARDLHDHAGIGDAQR